MLFFLFIFFVVAAAAWRSNADAAVLLFDFTLGTSINNFKEVSDATAREAGLSKASLVFVNATSDPRSVFFTLLVPQPDGACFAGVEDAASFQAGRLPADWAVFSDIYLTMRSSGPNSVYKVVLKDSYTAMENSSVTFEHYFTTATAGQGAGGWQAVSVPLADFACTYHGQACDYSLDRSEVVSFGLQMAGGVYTDAISQQGVGALELREVALR